MNTPIPPIIVSTIMKFSKKNVNRKVKEAPLIKKGLPSLPTNLSESAYLNAAADVPIEWQREMYHYLCESGDGPSRSLISDRFCVPTGLGWKTLHLLVHLIQTQRTEFCYINTSGSLDKVGEKLKRDNYVKWTIKPDYESTIRLLSDCTGDSVDSIFQADRMIRSKRGQAAGGLGIRTPEGRDFCHIRYYNDKGYAQHTWVAVGHSADLLLVSDAEIPACCHIDDCDVNTNLLQCSRCKKVFYCSKLHQKNDWSSHKLTCKV